MPTNDPNLPLSDIVDVLRQRVDQSTLLSIVKDLEQAAREAAADRAKDKAPKTKNRFVVLLRSDDEAVARAVQTGGFIVTVPDDTTDTYHGDALLQRLAKAVAHHNETPGRGRGKRNHRAIKTFVEAMERLKAKSLAATDSPKVRIKTRLPVEIVVVRKETL